MKTAIVKLNYAQAKLATHCKFWEACNSNEVILSQHYRVLSLDTLIYLHAFWRNVTHSCNNLLQATKISRGTY